MTPLPPTSTAARRRREPVQKRSRLTVTRILDAAAELIDESGVEAAGTRAVADRAGVAYPSLYRFFADREEILDRLLERHVAELDARVTAAESRWQITSAGDLINRELDLHIAYYEEHPSSARLWLSGRSSPTVVEHVRRRNRALAERMRTVLIAEHIIAAETDPLVLVLVVELGDRILDLAFRDRATADPAIVALGRIALSAYARDALVTSETSRA